MDEFIAETDFTQLSAVDFDDFIDSIEQEYKAWLDMKEAQFQTEQFDLQVSAAMDAEVFSLMKGRKRAQRHF